MQQEVFIAHGSDYDPQKALDLAVGGVREAANEQLAGRYYRIESIDHSTVTLVGRRGKLMLLVTATMLVEYQ